MGTWEHIKLGEFPWNNALRFFCWGGSLKIHTEIKSELFTDGCICAPKKERQKKEKYGCIFYLWFTSIAPWCELAPWCEARPLCAVLSTIGSGCPSLWCHPDFLSQGCFFTGPWLALSMSGIKFWGAASPPPFFSNNKMQQKRNT
jgi:hypothetical protein